jgi:hypothetical protein
MNAEETVAAVCTVLSNNETASSVLEGDLADLFGTNRLQLVRKILQHRDDIVSSYKVINFLIF